MSHLSHQLGFYPDSLPFIYIFLCAAVSLQRHCSCFFFQEKNYWPVATIERGWFGRMKETSRTLPVLYGVLVSFPSLVWLSLVWHDWWPFIDETRGKAQWPRREYPTYNRRVTNTFCYFWHSSFTLRLHQDNDLLISRQQGCSEPAWQRAVVTP